MSDTQSVLIAVGVIAMTTYLVFRVYNSGREGKPRAGDGSMGTRVAPCDAKWPFPKLKSAGTFEHTRAATESRLEECKSDFCRIAWTMTDLLIASPGAPLPEVWKFPGFGGKRDAATPDARGGMVASLDAWLRVELKRVEVEPAEGLTVRVVDLLSVTPAVTFAIRHEVPLQILQAKYVVAVSSSGQVRVLFYAFVTDRPRPGAKSGPFTLKLVSANLNVASTNKDDTTVLAYRAKRNEEVQMCAVLAADNAAMRGAVLRDMWDEFSRA